MLEANKSHNINLDLLKLIACIGVIGLHTFSPYYVKYALPLYYLCGFAVPVFFMVSGYLLLSKRNITRDYIKHKISNIFRIVIMWNILRWLVSLSKVLLCKDISEYSILYLIKQIIGSLIQRGKMWQFWYLGALMILYLCLPVLHYTYTKKIVYRNYKISLASVLWVLLLLISVMVQMCSMIQGETLQRNIVQTFRIWSWLKYFLLGGLMSHVSSMIIDKISIKVHFIFLGISSIFIVCYQYIAGRFILNTMEVDYFYDSIFMTCWVVIVFTCFFRLNFSRIKGEKLTSLCALTLGVYIVHPTIISIIGKIVSVNSFGVAVVNFFAVTMISFITVYAMSKIKFIKKYLLTM